MNGIYIYTVYIYFIFNIVFCIKVAAILHESTQLYFALSDFCTITTLVLFTPVIILFVCYSYYCFLFMYSAYSKISMQKNVLKFSECLVSKNYILELLYMAISDLVL